MPRWCSWQSPSRVVKVLSKISSWGSAAAALAPPVGEEQCGLGSLWLGDAGVAVAQRAGVGVARDESEDALLLAGAFRDKVLADEGVVAVVGDGVEVEVEGVAARQALLVESLVPQAREGADVARVDAAGILGERGALGDAIQAGEEGQARVADLAVDMGVAGGAVEFEGEQREHGVAGRAACSCRAFAPVRGWRQAGRGPAGGRRGRGRRRVFGSGAVRGQGSAGRRGLRAAGAAGRACGEAAWGHRCRRGRGERRSC